MTRGFLISSVKPDSPADKAGIEPGDRLFKINGSTFYDILDYRYLVAGKEARFLVAKRRGRKRDLLLVKDYDEDPGLGFTNATLGPLRKCQNNCIFCFVDQQPMGLRKTMYEKDDDYRLSFLHGNYISLSNAGSLELNRIIRRRLSPLYISVHATSPAVRRKMMRNPAAGHILRQLKILARAGITMHGQIVICPGINDGSVLRETLRDLSALFPAFQTVALVPVGLTRYREDLYPLQGVTPGKAAEILAEVTPLQARYLKERGAPFVYLADEFYHLAGATFPADEHYGAYAQLENGVGMGRLFLNELESWNNGKDLGLTSRKVVSLVTGRLAEPLLQAFAAELRKNVNLDVRVHVLESSFWGPDVTAAGLLTGSDLLEGLQGKELGDLAFIPANILKEHSSLLLDGYSLDNLSVRLKTPLLAAEALQDIRLQIKGSAPGRFPERKVTTCQNR